MRQRRLLAVSHAGVVSGAERVLVRLLCAARADGWQVSCAAPPGPLREQLRAKGIEVVPIPDLKLTGGPRWLAAARLPLAWGRAATALRRPLAKTDVVLANGLLALPPLRLLRRRRLRVAWLVHDVIHQRDWLALLRLVAPVVTLALPVSDAVARPLVAAGVRCRVVRNGTAWPVPAARDPLDGSPVIGVNAMLTSWKGQDVLLEAVARLKRPEVRVELMGGQFPRDAPFVAQLRARGACPDLAGRVRFLGHVGDPLERLRSWTVAVVASVEPEAAPLALLEEMSVGVPIVATEHGGTPEVIGAAGLLVPPRDPEAMTAALARLLDDPDLRARCRNAGRAAIDPELTLTTQARRFLAVLDDLTVQERE